MANMKYKRLLISLDRLKVILANGHLPAVCVENGIPADAELINVRHAWPNGIELLIESEEFAPVEEGETIPALQPKLERAREVVAQPD